MPAKGKILMGKKTPAKMQKELEFVSQSKTNPALLYGKKTGKTYVKEGSESYAMIRTPGKRPGPVKPKPLVIEKQIPNNKRNLPGPVMPPPKGGDPIRPKGDRSKMVQAPKQKKPIGRGGR